MFQKRARVCALGLAALLAGCRQSGLQSCQDLIEKSRYEEAAQRCAQVYEEEKDARAGASAVLAHSSLGHGDEVLAWVARLAKDGKVRPGIWGLAAAVHQQRGDFDAAEREYRSDLALHQAGGNHQRAADTLIRLFGLSWQRSRYRDAFLFAGQALEEASKAGDRDLELRSTRALYKVLYAVGDLEGARQVLKKGGLNPEPEPAWAWDLEYQHGQAEEAVGDLRAAEAAYRKSAGIVEETRRSLPFDDLKPWLADRKRRPFEALFRLEARSGRAEEALATADRVHARTLLDAFLQTGPPPGSRSEAPLSTDILAARIRDRELLLPALSESPVAASKPIDQVLTAFGDRHGLVYFEAGEDLWLITVSGRKVRLHALTASTSEVRRLGQQYVAQPDDASVASRLGEILLPPESLPEPGKTVYIVAGGVLGNLPFAALRRKDRYLVEDHAISLIPSLSALAALESHPRDETGPPLVLADPRGNLPAAALEGREVAKLLGGALRTGGAATFGALRASSRARILHLATHTGLSARGPWILLADRRVNATEIVTSRTGPRMVVLASCASAARPGRQMWGSLGAAFLAAGSRSVLASLWSVEDAPTRELVLRFYADGGASNPAGALARAQRVAIRQGLSPRVWGPFVLFGS